MTIIPRQSLKELYKLLGIPYEEPEERPHKESMSPNNPFRYLKIKKTITKRTEAADENFSKKE